MHECFSTHFNQDKSGTSRKSKTNNEVLSPFDIL